MTFIHKEMHLRVPMIEEQGLSQPASVLIGMPQRTENKGETNAESQWKRPETRSFSTRASILLDDFVVMVTLRVFC
jgi:hypothetical protein